MSRPQFITYQDTDRWDKIIAEDPLLKTLPEEFINSPLLQEVCYAGLYLAEQLETLQCPSPLITRIQYHAGKLSFGRDAWDTHLQILQDYQDNKLIFEDEPNQTLN